MKGETVRRSRHEGVTVGSEIEGDGDKEIESKKKRNEMRMGNERNEDVGLHIVRDSAAGLESREILSQGAFKIWPTVHYFYEGMT